jgi:site-specific recombinase XerD
MERTDYYEIAKQKLKYFNYSKRTTEVYCHYIDKFLKHYPEIAPSRLTSSAFQNYLNRFEFTSISQQNQVINAIKFLYEKVLNRKYDKIDFTRPRKEKHLPQIIDSEYVVSKINAITNLKHKAILTLAYSVGLRVSEVINLKIEDIDSKRMLINIRQAKGKKDRIVPLSQNVLNLFREYYKKYRPKEYLFNGQFSLQYSSESCNKIVKHYMGEQYHFHQLRHSCFTALLEKGTDLRIIQKLAGHSSSKTTEIYTHVSNTILQKIQLPI